MKLAAVVILLLMTVILAGIGLFYFGRATPAASAGDKMSAKTLSPSVRAVAADPAAHLGHLILLGVVGIVTPGKGFVLVDLKEYQEEGFACLTTDEPTKLPVEWAGVAPKVKEKLRVDGTLVKGKRGYAFIAKKVTKP